MAAGQRVSGCQTLAPGDPEHLPDQIDAGHLLGHRMLHLEPGVDFEEGDCAVGPDEELTRAGPDIARVPENVLGRLVEHRGLFLIQERRGRFFDQLLVAPLQRTVPGGHHHDRAVAIGEALGFDVARPIDVALHETLASPERRACLAHRRVVQFGNLADGPGDLQPAAAATKRCLDGDRQTVLLGEGDGRLRRADRPFRAGHQRGPDLRSDPPGGDLVAKRADRPRRGTDPDQSGIGHRLGELGVLGQEPVAGMHRVRAGQPGGSEYLADVQIAGSRRVTAECERLVGKPHVRSVPIGFRVHGNTRESLVTTGPDDADGNLTAIGDQHLVHESAPSRRTLVWCGLLRGKPYSARVRPATGRRARC